MMRLAFYRAWSGVDLLDWGVSIFSGFSAYSHVELVFSDGMCFSSTIRDDWSGSDELGVFTRTDGLRFKMIDFTKKPDHWRFAELPDFGQDFEAQIRRNCEAVCEERSARYDYGGVLAFVNPFAKEDPDKWFCSEAAAWAIRRMLRSMGILGGVPYHKISPKTLAKPFGKLLMYEESFGLTQSRQDAERKTDRPR